MAQPFRNSIVNLSTCHWQESSPPQYFHGTPDVTLFSDGYYCHTIYSIGPYIADGPEKVLLACIVQGWCVK